MESVTALEDPAAEECTCDAPFTLVRYRDPDQEPSFIDGVANGQVEEGIWSLTDADGVFLFGAPLDAILSIEKVA